MLLLPPEKNLGMDFFFIITPHAAKNLLLGGAFGGAVEGVGEGEGEVEKGGWHDEYTLQKDMLDHQYRCGQD